MTKISVTYKAPRGDDRVVEMRGRTFFDGKAEKLDSDADAAFLAKLRNNPLFQVDEKDAPKPAAPAPVKQPDAILIATEQSDGTFAVMSGATVVKGDMSKEDADAFNALSDADKAEYVK